MAVECGVIAGIFVLFVFVFFRRGHSEWALATLPLILLPLADFVLEMVIIKMLKVEVTAFGAILTLVVALAASAAWIGAASGTLRANTTKGPQRRLSVFQMFSMLRLRLFWLWIFCPEQENSRL